MRHTFHSSTLRPIRLRLPFRSATASAIAATVTSIPSSSREQARKSATES